MDKNEFIIEPEGRSAIVFLQIYTDMMNNISIFLNTKSEDHFLVIPKTNYSIYIGMANKKTAKNDFKVVTAYD